MKSEVTMESGRRPVKEQYMKNDRKGKAQAMMPNNRGGSFIEEDWSEPALLKRGVHEFTLGGDQARHRSGRIDDLYEKVQRTTNEDQRAFDSLTDPNSW
jgi:hypothetical protein